MGSWWGTHREKDRWREGVGSSRGRGEGWEEGVVCSHAVTEVGLWRLGVAWCCCVAVAVGLLGRHSHVGPCCEHELGCACNTNIKSLQQVRLWSLSEMFSRSRLRTWSDLILTSVIQSQVVSANFVCSHLVLKYDLKVSPLTNCDWIALPCSIGKYTRKLFLVIKNKHYGIILYKVRIHQRLHLRCNWTIPSFKSSKQILPSIPKKSWLQQVGPSWANLYPTLVMDHFSKRQWRQQLTICPTITHVKKPRGVNIFLLCPTADLLLGNSSESGTSWWSRSRKSSVAQTVSLCFGKRFYTFVKKQITLQWSALIL